MEQPIQLPDVVKPRPQFFMSESRGGLQVYQAIASWTHLVKAGEPTLVVTVYWIGLGYPPTLFFSAMFFQN